MTDLMELASRVEAGEGPDAMLDLAIFQAVTGKEGIVRCMGREGISAEVPAYTASLDAAMSLVPEGWDFSIEPRHALVVLDDGWNLARFEAKAATPARALTAAALRARAHQGTAHVEQ